MPKQKQFNKPPKKQKAKPAAPVTADDFQEAADLEEDTGGKWRAGDPAKSGRAFVRALDWYDKGLARHPQSFDLAYNKARLQLEITQSPALVEHIRLPLGDLLSQTLESHRYALRLNEENPDVLFNTAQVLTSLAEKLTEAGNSVKAVPLLHEALELLNGCLARQEMLCEQQQADAGGDAEDDDMGDGGVPLQPGPDERPASTPSSEASGQMVTIENPVTPSDLLDTAQASLSALTTLVPLVDSASLGRLGDMAHSLTETKVPYYISLLPANSQMGARLYLGLARANFIAAFADAQFSNHLIDWQTYFGRLNAYDIPEKAQDNKIAIAEAQATREAVLSMIDRFRAGPMLPTKIIWTALSKAQKLLSAVVDPQAGQEPQLIAQAYLSKGDTEMLRHRVVTVANDTLSDAIMRSGPTLLQNARKFYEGARDFALANNQNDVAEQAGPKWLVAWKTRSLLHADLPDQYPQLTVRDLDKCVADVVDEGLMEATLAQEVLRRAR